MARKSSRERPARPPAGAPASALPDPGALHALLDRDHDELRTRVLEALTSPSFLRPPPADAAAYRALVLEWVEELARAGFGALAYPREFGGEHDATRSIAVFETLAYHDLSLLVKFGVQFGLFGGSIFWLGTRSHHERWLAAAGSLALPGCFAMTETDHGSNVREIRTTATFDPAAGEFVIHTPEPGARKDYIGNAALHGRMAVVFAQLDVGGTSHGVHALVVPLRGEDGRVLPGVSIEDCGMKEGLNGVDNGRITFDHVRVPRDHLLDRYARVRDDGTYHSPIADPGRRFFTMLGALVVGRVSIAAAAMNASKSGLAIAIRYTDVRRQFGPTPGEEVPVLDYLDMQRRLLPRLATTYALDFGLKDLIRELTERNDDNTREIEARAAGFKAYASAHAVESLLACRQACGGQGYMAENRLPALLVDTDVFTTFEGANPVLLQLVARALLTEYREEFGELGPWAGVRWLAGRAAARLAELNPVITRRTDEEHLLDPGFHRAALEYREERLLGSLARRLRRRIGDGMPVTEAFNACQDHAIALASAHVEQLLLDRFLEGIETAGDRALADVLRPVCALFALTAIERDRGWFLESGYLEPGKSKAVREMVNRLLGRLRPWAVPLADGFGIPEPLLPALVRRD